jgi:hypothetical protein
VEPSIVRNGITIGAIVNALLVCIGILIHPASTSGTSGLLSLLGPALILPVYFVIGQRAGRATSPVIRIGAVFGLAAGIVFGFEILLEYLILPDTSMNTRLGWIEFGTAFLLFALAAFWTAYSIGEVRAGVRAAFWSSIVASTIWLTVLLLVTYAFWGTVRQEQVFRAEGDYEDFVRSGMHDFRAFMLQDLRGASFFHLLLAPPLAMLLGLASSAIGKALHKRPR